jgi:hypothetical protein
MTISVLQLSGDEELDELQGKFISGDEAGFR